MEEEWRDISGYEGLYQVSNLGRVKKIYGNERILKATLNSHGLYSVTLFKGNEKHGFHVGALVGKAFLTKNNDTDVILHINDKSNDCVDNLKYISIEERRHLAGQASKKVHEKEEYLIAKEKGISSRTAYMRTRQGWSMEEAIEIPVKRKTKILKQKLYEYNGKLYTAKELAKISSGITIHAIRGRLKLGWSIEEVLEVPLQIQRKGRKVK